MKDAIAQLAIFGMLNWDSSDQATDFNNQLLLPVGQKAIIRLLFPLKRIQTPVNISELMPCTTFNNLHPSERGAKIVNYETSQKLVVLLVVALIGKQLCAKLASLQ
jgi:hypothetical protein